MPASKDIRQRLLATFQIEHRDHVENIRSLLAIMEKTGAPARGELEEVFRRAHSLKGAARAVDLRPVEGLAHRLETLFSRVRQGVLPFDANVARVVGQALDASEDCLTALGDNHPTPGFGPALQALERVLGMEAEPSVATEPEIPASVPSFQPLDTVRITTQNFDGLLRSAGGLLAESQRQNQVTAQLNGIARQIAGIEKEAASVRQGAAVLLGRLGPRREFARVGAFLDSMQERTRSLARQTGAIRRLHQRSCWTMNRLGQQLQKDVWQARMVPAESLLEGSRKMMRDLARDEGKEIDFRATSANVQADRAVIEALKDPLLHALRNAVSHGIESPPERVAKGKPPTGLVTLRIDTENQRLTIAIEDDGRGVDLARVAEVAVRQRILSEVEATRSSPRELGRILFRPGFSTFPSVTELAGRGMGLSVVYEAVRRLQGDVDLHPREGSGTALHLSVPQSISTHRFLVMSCSGQPFALPIHWIESLHRIKLQNVETMEGNPVIILNGRPVPLYRLQHLLHLDPPAANSEPGVRRIPSGADALVRARPPGRAHDPVVNSHSQQDPGIHPDTLRIMILHSRGTRTAVAVDAFLREIEAVIQDLGPAAPRGGKISGGILLEDGAVALVLSPVELLETSEPQEALSVLRPAQVRQQEAAHCILVVDDSLTTRTLEKSILEAHGYQVRVAVDGVEALTLLRAEKSDLVITDIQMPRMDGFQLLEAMKKDPRLDRIPVVVVTSLDRREDQERGLQLGADAYIVKRKFDQAELLAAIRQIL